MYTEAAAARRRCTARRADGEPCCCWAVWDDPRQLCVNHAGRHHRGPMPDPSARPLPARGARPACRCGAYAWPHRPGGGLCRWPDPPSEIHPSVLGTRRFRLRASGAMGRRGIHTLRQFAAAVGW